jgi:AcrR family transcriptional regulator
MRAKQSSTANNSTFIGDARRRQILQSAIETIAALGYSQTSLAQIADDAGISKGVILYHFSSKEDLLENIVREVCDACGLYMRSRISSQTNATEMLRAYITSNLTFMQEHRSYLIALVDILRNARTKDGSPLVNPAKSGDVVKDLETILAKGQKIGEFRHFHTKVVALCIRSAIDAIPPQMVSEPGLELDFYAQELSSLFERAIVS